MACRGCAATSPARSRWKMPSPRASATPATTPSARPPGFATSSRNGAGWRRRRRSESSPKKWRSGREQRDACFTSCSRERYIPGRERQTEAQRELEIGGIVDVHCILPGNFGKSDHVRSVVGSIHNDCEFGKPYEGFIDDRSRYESAPLRAQ